MKSEDIATLIFFIVVCSIIAAFFIHTILVVYPQQKEINKFYSETNDARAFYNFCIEKEGSEDYCLSQAERIKLRNNILEK